MPMTSYPEFSGFLYLQPEYCVHVVLFSHIGCMFVCMCACMCVCEFSLCVGMCFSTSCVLAILYNMVSVRDASLFLSLWRG